MNTHPLKDILYMMGIQEMSWVFIYSLTLTSQRVPLQLTIKVHSNLHVDSEHVEVAT